MQGLQYHDPLSRVVPALERDILKYRSMEVVLILFYTEQLKYKIQSLVQETDSFRADIGVNNSVRVQKHEKDQFKKCLNALQADKAISVGDGNEIEKLIKYRNLVAHDIHEIFFDIADERNVRKFLQPVSDFISAYNIYAVTRLQHYIDILNREQMTRPYIGTIGIDNIKFVAAERVLLDELGKLKKRIDRKIDKRNEKILKLNDELLSGHEIINEQNSPLWLNQYDNKRLTRRGVEICYRLFDRGKSALAIAFMMDISLTSARKRQRMWKAIGGLTRPAVDFDSLPRRKFYVRMD